MAARHTSPAVSLFFEDLVVMRIFDSPRETVWKAWTDPKHFMRGGTERFHIACCKIDLRVGESTSIACSRPRPGLLEYGRVSRHRSDGEDCLYNSFADCEGNVVAASYYGMHDMALEMVVTVTFEEDGGQTIMTLRHGEIPRNMKRDCEAGWEDPSIAGRDPLI